MPRTPRCPDAFIALVVAALLSHAAVAQEWTRFRGPNGTGVSEAKTIPVQWTDAEVNWKTELPGLGHSSPVVWGEKVFLLSADPDNATRYVVCIHAADGKTLWVREFPSETHTLHKFSSYGSATPAVDAERVYVAWSKYPETTLMALDHEGNQLWQLNLGRWIGQHGFGISPMLYQDMVILSNSLQGEQLEEGQTPGESFVAAFDQKTGKEIWRTPRTSAYVCYSTPFIYQPPGGDDELVCINTKDGVYSLDPMTGKENWATVAFDKRAVSSPILAGGLIFGSTGSGGGGANYVAAVRPGKDGEVAYTFEETSAAPYVPTIVGIDGLVFLWADKGIVTCLEAATGEEHWRERVGGNFFSSPIIVNGKLYNASDTGEVVVLAASKQYQLLARNSLGDATRATPAVAGGRMYLRTFSHLISIGGGEL